MASSIEVVQDNTDAVLKEFETATSRSLEEVGILAEGHSVGYITEQHIVDTGRLRNSVTHAVDEDGKAAIVGTNVEYAPYVHNGTRRMPGRPFLTVPIQQHADEYREVFDKNMGGSR